MRKTALRTTALLALAAMLFTASATALAETTTVYYINGVAYTSTVGGTTTAGSTAPTTGSAAYTAYSTALTGVNKETVIIRKAAISSTSSSNRVASVKKGNTFTILGKSGSYYYVRYNSYEGFARMKDFTLSASSGTATAATTPTYTAYPQSYTGVNKETVIIRKAAISSTSSYNRVASVKRGNTFTILGTSGSYYYVRYNSYEGFARMKDFTLSASSGTAAAATTPSYTAYPQSYTGVNKETVIIRKAAISSTSSSNRVTSVKKGNTFTILGENGSYYYAKYNSYEGFARKQDFTVYTSGTAATAPTTSASNPTSNTWGHLQIDGTNINQSVMANTVINGKYKYETSSMAYFYALTDYSSQISIILGHNLRSSGTRFHQLHHVQNAWLGKSTCEYCGKSCSSAQTRYFNLSWQGYTKWELVCFYETEHNEPASTLEFNARPYNTSASAWLNYQLSRAASNSKGMVVGSATSGDRLVMLVGCGDYYSKTSNARIYMVLKAVS